MQVVFHTLILILCWQWICCVYIQVYIHMCALTYTYMQSVFFIFFSRHEIYTYTSELMYTYTPELIHTYTSELFPWNPAQKLRENAHVLLACIKYGRDIYTRCIHMYIRTYIHTYTPDRIPQSSTRIFRDCVLPHEDRAAPNKVYVCMYVCIYWVMWDCVPPHDD
jgi:hypothetical protein